MFELDQIGNELSPYEDKLKDMGKLLGVEEAKEKIAELEEISADPEFWNDMAKSQKTMQTIKVLKIRSTAMKILFLNTRIYILS